jgi:hypothetical protein
MDAVVESGAYLLAGFSLGNAFTVVWIFDWPRWRSRRRDRLMAKWTTP